MRLVKGDALTPEQKAQVLAAFVHRYLDTTTKTDAEWLSAHAFYITTKGKLSAKHKHCEPSFMAGRG